MRHSTPIADAALLLVVIALLTIACLRIDAGAMAKCQERHSFSTCHHNLNR